MESKSTFVPHLVIIEGHEKGKVIPLKHGTAIIGRSKGDVIVQDPRVSRSHVAIQFDENTEQLTFTDLKSLNGTFINGEELKEGIISDGDRLQVGDTIFDCQMTKPETQTGLEISESASSLRPKEPKISAKPTRPKDPTLEPLAEEPSTSQAMSKKPKEKNKAGLRGMYLKIPLRKRIQYLSLITILIGAGYLATKQVGTANLSPKIAAIKKQAALGDLDQALDQALKLQKKYPVAKTYLLTGDIYAQKADFRNAIVTYQKAAKIQPIEPVVHAKLIRMYLVTKNNRGAVAEYTKLGNAIQETGKVLSTLVSEKKMKPEDAIKKNPYIRELFVETGQLFLDFKELEEPPQQLLLIARALQRDIAPDNPVGYKLEAKLLFQQNQTKPAVEKLEEALELNDRDRWVIENLALAKYRLKDYKGTEEIIKVWLENFPGSTRAYLTMSYLKFTQRDARGALPYLTKIIEIGNKNPKEPYLPEALYWVGQVFLQEQRVGEATHYVSQSCKLGYQIGCKSPLLERVPTSPKNRKPNSTKKKSSSKKGKKRK